MSFDQTPPIESTRRPNWEFPEIIAVRVQAAEYRPRETRNFANPLPAVKDAVEIVVSFGSPMPIRAKGPVLYVGEVPLTESEAVDREGKEIRFWAFDRAKLQAGAPITLAWSGEAPTKRQRGANFRFALPRALGAE